ncbi:hypothetical protein NUW58_g2579 [Xylaria curta]|uniref:Uncharacterized protein n=1 Tax=Xylaria curta TaxID=42375 RepID=A0ACC1PFE0_9PEZI|nr:hypothetical protein NUW58_g2579 [Xylaria curta]
MNERAVITEGQSRTVQLLLWFIFIVSVLTVTARLGTKYAMTRKLGWDDYIMLTAQIAYLGQCISLSVGAAGSLGTHASDLSDAAVDSFLKAEYASIAFLIISLALIKWSISAFIRQLSRSTIHRRVDYVLQATIGLWLLTSVLVSLFQCALPTPWDYFHSNGLECIDRRAWWIYVVILNILTDLFTVGFYILIIGNLQIPRRPGQDSGMVTVERGRQSITLKADLLEPRLSKVGVVKTPGSIEATTRCKVATRLQHVTQGYIYTFIGGWRSALRSPNPLRFPDPYSIVVMGQHQWYAQGTPFGHSVFNAVFTAFIITSPLRSKSSFPTMDSDTEKAGLQPGVTATVTTGHTSRDDASLARLGKKPVLKRNFGFLTILGFSCTVLITWEGSLLTFLAGLQNGGPSGIIYSFIVVWVGTLSTFITLGEMVSMAPTSGGQYHWVSMLAPPSSRKFLGYLTGWLTLTGWQSLVASGGFVTGTMIQGLILLTHPEYAEIMQNWHGTLLFWGVVLFGYTINAAIGVLLARFEGCVLILHILGFFAVIFPLALLSQHNTPADVFNTFLNLGGWQTQGLSFSIGIMGNVFAFLGGDGAIHMSEEIRNAAVVIPRSLLTGLAINGTLGFSMLIATLFSIGSIDEALTENPHYPFMAIFRHAVGSTAGATVMASIVVVMSFSATTNCMASTSRLYWAFARDRGLPVTAIIAILLSLVNIGDATAFNGVISISIAGLFGSYFIAAALLLYRRSTGGIRVRQEEDVLVNTMGSTLTWGPWRLRGSLGIANNAFACAYLLYIFFFSFWPSVREVTAQTFNYSILVFGVVLLFSMTYYAKWFAT